MLAKYWIIPKTKYSVHTIVFIYRSIVLFSYSAWARMPYSYIRYLPHQRSWRRLPLLYIFLASPQPSRQFLLPLTSEIEQMNDEIVVELIYELVQSDNWTIIALCTRKWIMYKLMEVRERAPINLWSNKILWHSTYWRHNITMCFYIIIKAAQRMINV